MESLFNDNPELKKQLSNHLTEEQLKEIVCKNNETGSTFHEKLLLSVHLLNCIIDQLPSDTKPELISELKKYRRGKILVANEKTKNLLTSFPMFPEVWEMVKENCDKLIRSTDDKISDKEVLETHEIYNICLQTQLRELKDESEMIERLADEIQIEKEKKKSNGRALMIVVIIFVLIGIGVIVRMVLNRRRHNGTVLTTGGMLRSPSFHNGLDFAQDLYA